MKPKTEKPYNNKRWTKAQLESYIVAGIRKLWLGWGVRRDVMDAAFVERKTNAETNRIAKHYRCAHCNKTYPGRDVNVDHITPVVDPNEGRKSWDEYIERMLVEADKLQVLCKTCHDAKTAEENKTRRSKK